jgi:hypothetical protein
VKFKIVTILSHYACAGTLTAEQQRLQFALDQPNRFRALIHYMKQPDVLIAYIQQNCTTIRIGAPEGATEEEIRLYSRFLPDAQAPAVENATFFMCRDTFGAFEEYLRCELPK